MDQPNEPNKLPAVAPVDELPELPGCVNFFTNEAYEVDYFLKNNCKFLMLAHHCYLFAVPDKLLATYYFVKGEQIKALRGECLTAIDAKNARRLFRGQSRTPTQREAENNLKNLLS